MQSVEKADIVDSGEAMRVGDYKFLIWPVTMTIKKVREDIREKRQSDAIQNTISKGTVGAYDAIFLIMNMSTADIQGKNKTSGSSGTARFLMGNHPLEGIQNQFVYDILGQSLSSTTNLQNKKSGAVRSISDKMVTYFDNAIEKLTHDTNVINRFKALVSDPGGSKLYQYIKNLETAKARMEQIISFQKTLKDDDTLETVYAFLMTEFKWGKDREKERRTVINHLFGDKDGRLLESVLKSKNERNSPKKALADALKNSKAVILYGPPGTGKTWLANEVAREMTGEKGEKKPQRVKLIQFHPGYSYFDFVEGIEAGKNGFQPKAKIFREWCDKATKAAETAAGQEKQPAKPINYVLIIDEINRADAASVLGELLYALEYRGQAVETGLTGQLEAADNQPMPPLTVPDNLYIIGTMNTADRSIGSLDYAVRRRFAFVQVPSAEIAAEVGKNFYGNAYRQVCADVRGSVARGVDAEDILPGGSYFLAKDKDELRFKLEYQLIPLLQEYVKNGLISKKRGKLRGNLEKPAEYLDLLAKDAEGGGSAG